jgi:hypothetical protein
MVVLAGMPITALVQRHWFQSSSITTGLCILLVHQNLSAGTAAILIVIGANIGTTATALVASIKMRKTVRRVAVAKSLLQHVWGGAVPAVPGAVRGDSRRTAGQPWVAVHLPGCHRELFGSVTRKSYAA